MRHSILYLFLLFIFFYSCKSSTNKVNQQDNDKNVDSLLTNVSDKFYKRYEGTIAGKAVTLHLVKYDSNYHVNYYYNGEGKNISWLLNQDSVPVNDTIYLLEYDPTTSSESLPEVHLSMNQDSITGIWVNSSRHSSYPIVLKESYPPGSARFSVIGYSSTYTDTSIREDKPSVKTSQLLVRPVDQALQENWFLQSLLHTAYINDSVYLGLPFEKAVEYAGNDFVQNFKNDLDSIKKQKPAPEKWMAPFLHYEQAKWANLIYNDNDFCGISIQTYEFTGGAHGMNWTYLANFDIKNKKLLQLSDIINIQPDFLGLLMEKYFRLTYNLRPGEPLTSVLFVKKLEPINNFYFTNKGIAFVYQPYEIAPYAYGSIQIWIPYTDLKQYLNADFAKRMGIL